MNNGTLEDLFLQELRETYAAERLILGGLAMPADAAKGVDTFLRRYVTRTRERIRHLEPIFALAGCTPDESSRAPTAGIIAEISGLAARSG
jgi:ferritin-like metal-binding protein YciE